MMYCYWDVYHKALLNYIRHNRILSDSQTHTGRYRLFNRVFPTAYFTFYQLMNYKQFLYHGYEMNHECQNALFMSLSYTATCTAILVLLVLILQKK